MSIQIARLYSIVKFLEKVEEGDSLTDLERKTHLSNVTVQGVVKDLESSAILTTRWRRTSRGKIRECVNISKPAKMLATQLIQILEGAEYFFESALSEDIIEYSIPLVFQMAILHKTMEKISQSLNREISKEVGDLFRKWICSKGEISELGDFENLINELLKVENSAIVRNGESIYFNPDMFTVFVDFSAERLKTEDSDVWVLSGKKVSQEEAAAE